MHIADQIAGMQVNAAAVRLLPRDTMNFAASVADLNPLYFDDTKGPPLAPPLFAVAVSWPLMSKLQQQLVGRIPMPAQARMVHAQEELHFCQPLQAGMTLDLHAVVASLTPTSAGALMRTVVTASERDEVVFRENTCALFRGVTCESQGETSAPDVAEDAGSPPTGTASDQRMEVSIDIPPGAAHVYDGCTGIHFPIHTSQGFARQAGLPGPILQGTATLAYACREIVNLWAEGDPQRLQSMSSRFASYVLPGQTLSLHSGQGRFEVRRQDGTVALSDGRFALK
jgi:acyl dehydratase